MWAKDNQLHKVDSQTELVKSTKHIFFKSWLYKYAYLKWTKKL
jgi:hypothetical protein